MLPINYLRSKYIELSSVFINEVNNNTITLYMSTNESMTANDVNDGHIVDFSRYGGRQNLNDFPDRQNEDGNNLTEEPLSLVIPARTYWIRKSHEGSAQNAGVILPTSQCTIITYLDNMQYLLDCDYAIINNIKCKLIKDPVPYGLFGKQWVSADFQVITGG